MGISDENEVAKIAIDETTIRKEDKKIKIQKAVFAGYSSCYSRLVSLKLNLPHRVDVLFIKSEDFKYNETCNCHKARAGDSRWSHTLN